MTMVDRAVRVAMPAEMQLIILGILWRSERWISLAAVHRAVCREYKPVALTTTSTIILRMVDHGWVERNRNKGTYCAGISREELISLLAEKIESAGL
jgi:predicted transcriptional regulator